MYGRDALRRFRELHKGAAQEPSNQVPVWTDVPSDAPADDATITVWNGSRFISYEKWQATAPLAVDEPLAADQPNIPAGAGCVVGDCGNVRVWLVRDGERWLMFAGSRNARGRRRDFASPSLAIAVKTAERWYGAPGHGWRPEIDRETSEAKAEGAEVLR